MPLPNEDTTPPVTNTKRVKVVSLNYVSEMESVEREPVAFRLTTMAVWKGQDRRADRVPNCVARFQTRQWISLIAESFGL